MAKIIWIINMDNTFISTAPHPEFTAVVHENIGIDGRANVLSVFLSITIHHKVIHEGWLFDRDIDLAAVLAKPIHLFCKACGHGKGQCTMPSNQYFQFMHTVPIRPVSACTFMPFDLPFTSNQFTSRYSMSTTASLHELQCMMI